MFKEVSRVFQGSFREISRVFKESLKPQSTKTAKRRIKGMKKCNNCGVCPYIKQGKVVQATETNYRIDIMLHN